VKNEDRDKIIEKRSSLRSWRERGGKMHHRRELISAAFIILIFLTLIVFSYWSGVQGNSSSPGEQQNKMPDPTPAETPVSIPAPGIKINSPKNITYSTSTPPLDFIVTGSNLDSVSISIDGGPKVTIPNDGTTAKIDFVRLNPLFIDDFSKTTEGRWKESGKWRVEGGNYITTGGTSSLGKPEWDNYIIETKAKITSGKSISIDLRWDGQGKYYRVQTPDAYNNFQLNKVDNKSSTTLSSTKLSGIDPDRWHTWKIVLNGSKIQTFIDDAQYIEHIDSEPYLKGNSRLSAVNSNAEYDYIQVYRPIQDGTHKLTIFANNTAGNASTRTVYFTINTTQVKAEEDTIGEIGVPLSNSGLEITVMSVTSGITFTSIWLSVKNTENEEKQFKLGSGTILIDNNGMQYENIKISRSAGIAQTDLYPQSMREGAVFFERLKEGASPKKLVLNVNGKRFEFTLD